MEPSSNKGDVWHGANGYVGNICVPVHNSEVQNWISWIGENDGFLATEIHYSKGQQISTSEESIINLRPKTTIQHIACPVNTTFENDQ